KLDGRSLVPLALAPPDEREPRGAYAETLHPLMRSGGEQLRSYRTADWKIVRHLRDGEVDREELYSLTDDPGELHDRAGSPDAEAERAKLAGELDRESR